MNNLLDMLQQAFEAGSHNASEYEHGGRGYHPNFKEWVKQNMKEIEELYHFIKILDNHKSPNQNTP